MQFARRNMFIHAGGPEQLLRRLLQANEMPISV
jgi:hypothetical protein